MAVETEDMTGQPATLEEVNEAFQVVRRHRTNMQWGMKNPELFVYLGTIERCLALAATVAKPREG